MHFSTIEVSNGPSLPGILNTEQPSKRVRYSDPNALRSVSATEGKIKENSKRVNSAATNVFQGTQNTATLPPSNLNSPFNNFSLRQTESYYKAKQYFYIGTQASNNGDFDTAISLFTQAIDLAPYLAGPYLNRGSAYARNGDLCSAIIDYTSLISLMERGLERAYSETGVVHFPNPKFAMAFANRGFANFYTGNLTAAISDYRKGIKINPNDSGLKKLYDTFAQSLIVPDALHFY